MHYPQEVLGRILEEARRATPGDEVPKSITLLVHVEDLVAAAGSKTIVLFGGCHLSTSCRIIISVDAVGRAPDGG